MEEVDPEPWTSFSLEVSARLADLLFQDNLPPELAAFPGLSLRLGSSFGFCLQICKDKLHSMHILPFRAASGVGHLQIKTQTQFTNIKKKKSKTKPENLLTCFLPTFWFCIGQDGLNQDQNQTRASHSNGGKQDTTLILPETPGLKIVALKFIGKLLVMIFLALRCLPRE